MSNDKESIRAEVQNLGFSLAGFTTPDPLPGFSILQTWIQSGRHAEMGYLERPDTIAKRANPRLLMPECRSVIVLTAAYPAGKQNQRTPRIAAYAQPGRDYHHVFKTACNQLIETLTSLSQSSNSNPPQFKAFSDTAPILEKELAVRAGLGWIGKNGCLINPVYGSWLLLAEIFTSLEIEPDPPFSGTHCGSCQRCLDTCPAGCILPDRTVDAGRCISYLTIEHRTDIPLPLQQTLSDHIFGCDDCQDVCPWNRRAIPDPNSMFSNMMPHKGNLLSLEEALRLDEASFDEIFKSTPVNRAGWEGWLRNCLVAAGNSNDITLLPLISSLLKEHPSPMVRRHAAWACFRLEGNATS
jgi:epoxyqueuosine reductase